MVCNKAFVVTIHHNTICCIVYDSVVICIINGEVVWTRFEKLFFIPRNEKKNNFNIVLLACHVPFLTTSSYSTVDQQWIWLHISNIDL